MAGAVVSGERVVRGVVRADAVRPGDVLRMRYMPDVVVAAVSGPWREYGRTVITLHGRTTDGVLAEVTGLPCCRVRIVRNTAGRGGRGARGGSA